MRVALYLRVSTQRQAEKDLSIPDQRRQLREHCDREGLVVVGEYVEPGASATDDKRPQFQKMIDDACDPEHPFDLIIVHSFSRFFRDAFKSEFYLRKLRKHGVQLQSLTQPTNDDPQGEFIRRVLALFDEYASQENAKHVLRAMKENARQGYWNGGPPPYGYKTETVQVRANTEKKKLVINPTEAAIVELAFDLFETGNGSGPMGVRSIAAALNHKGLRYRKGRKFTSGLVHQILTRTAYAGEHFFNKREAKTKRKKDRKEWVRLETPIIIPPERFERAQALLKQRRPTNTPPRIVNGPTLLTGIAKCASCGGGMTLRTGKSGRYRYYVCNRSATEGKQSCKGRSIPMGTLDEMVLSQLESRVLEPGRIGAILAELVKRKQQSHDATRQQIKELRKELRKVEEKLQRLYGALAEGTVTSTDAFKNSVAALEQRREELLRLIASSGRRQELPDNFLDEIHIKKFTGAVHARLRDSRPAFRKAYVRHFVDRVELDDDEVRIFGSKAALVGGLADGPAFKPGEVPSSVREWWAL